MDRQLPELNISAGSQAEAEQLLAHGADAVTVGEERYALRTPGDVDLAALQAIAEAAHGAGKRVYVLVNALLHNESLHGVEEYLQAVAEAGADAIVFGDPAVYMAARRVAPGLELHWSTETTSTNWRTVNFWARKGAGRALLARELSLNEVVEIKRNSMIPIQVQVHGMTCIFHSKRELVTNYLRAQQRDGKRDVPPNQDVLQNEGVPLFLREHTREGQRYPVLENAHGTHIMSSDDICMLPHLAALLAAGIDSFYIEGFGKSLAYNCQVVSLYRQALEQLRDQPEQPVDPAYVEAIQAIQPANRPLGTGFFFKEQIY
ncbi:peptidase U32 family protein [Brevibacillus marinus]|uniref:peptidase U32 family protein n=1 Tax=Brevibacillus marinus TaxID=2496837 RepID=UPI000F824231|nr:peptidase U32 family protein [Brevibacillus marinus]